MSSRRGRKAEVCPSSAKVRGRQCKFFSGRVGRLVLKPRFFFHIWAQPLTRLEPHPIRRTEIPLESLFRGGCSRTRMDFQRSRQANKMDSKNNSSMLGALPSSSCQTCGCAESCCARCKTQAECNNCGSCCCSAAHGSWRKVRIGTGIRVEYLGSAWMTVEALPPPARPAPQSRPSARSLRTSRSDGLLAGVWCGG